tara:strand:+ start:314 stop:616 length:303 start_codon:yes stop_codon:yes gene_type:complete
MDMAAFRRKFSAWNESGEVDERVQWKAYVDDRVEDFYFCYEGEDGRLLKTSWREPEGEITEAAAAAGAVDGPYLRYSPSGKPLPSSKPLYSRADGSSFAL